MGRSVQLNVDFSLLIFHDFEAQVKAVLDHPAITTVPLVTFSISDKETAPWPSVPWTSGPWLRIHLLLFQCHMTLLNYGQLCSDQTLGLFPPSLRLAYLVSGFFFCNLNAEFLFKFFFLNCITHCVDIVSNWLWSCFFVETQFLVATSLAVVLLMGLIYLRS